MFSVRLPEVSKRWSRGRIKWYNRGKVKYIKYMVE